MQKNIRRKATSAATAILTLALLSACGDGGTASASPSASARPSTAAPTTAAPTVAAPSAAPSNVALKSFAFADGAVFTSALAGKAASLAFGGNASTFTLSSGGSTASGGNTFGSCILTITSSTFTGVSDLAVGKTITLNPCAVTSDGTLRIQNGTLTGTSSASVAAASPSASPTAAPTAAPTVAATAARTVAPTPAPTVAPTPAPTLAPTPAPTAAAGYPGGIANASGPTIPGFTRYTGKVTDSVTGAPIAGACVYAGPPVDCPVPSVISDAGGNYAIDFPSGTTWQFNFQHPAYTPVLQRTGVSLAIQMAKK